MSESLPYDGRRLHELAGVLVDNVRELSAAGLTPATASVKHGNTKQLTATAYDASNNVLAGRTVLWTSSNAAVAKVSATGLVTGLTAGSVTITATVDGKSGTSTVTIT